MNTIRLRSTLTQHYIHVYKLTQYYGAIPLLFAPLANSPFTSFFTLFYLQYLDSLLAVIGSRPPWSQVTRELTSPFSTPPHSLPIPNSQYPSQISPASCANKGDDSTRLSRSGTCTIVHYKVCVRLRLGTAVCTRIHFEEKFAV